MPFTIKSRKLAETQLEADYKKQIAQHVRDNDPSIPKFPPTQLRSFALVDDTVTISTELSDQPPEQAELEIQKTTDDFSQDVRLSVPVTPAEKNELGIFSIRV